MLTEEMDHLLRGLWFHFQYSCKLVNYNASTSEETLYSPLALKGNWLAFSKSQIYRFPENIYCKTSFLYACIIFTKYTEYKPTYSFQSYGPPKESQNFYRLNRKHMETPLTVWLWWFECIFCSLNVTLRSIYRKGGFCLLFANFVRVYNVFWSCFHHYVYASPPSELIQNSILGVELQCLGNISSEMFLI